MKKFKIFPDPVSSKICRIEEAIIANKRVKMVLRILVMGLKLWVLLHSISFERKDCVFRKRTKTYRYHNKICYKEADRGKYPKWFIKVLMLFRLFLQVNLKKFR